jgi:tetratricopeptide (TPR) repeat protein
MRDNDTISNGAGACRALMRDALRCAPGLMLAFALGVAGVRAQSGQARESSTGAGDSTKSEQTRARRVAAGDSSLKKDNAGPKVEAEAAGPADEKAAASKVETEDEPPSFVDEASKSDRLSTLRAQIKDAKTDVERSRLRRTLVDYLVALDQKREAIDELRIMMGEERFDPIGFYNIGNALARLGDTDTAIEAYRKAIEQRRGHYSRALHNLGVLLMREGRWDEAQEALTSALRQEAYRYAEASYNLGRLYILRGEAALAIREWQRVLALQPDHADAALALARAYAEDGSPERAIGVIDSFTARRGANNQLAAARREILYNAESYDPSDTKAMTPVSRTGSGASAPQAKAVESSARPAASSSLRSLSVDRETYDLLERARAAREAGKDQEALNFYARVLSRRGGFFPPANLEISFVLSGLNRHEEAIANLQKLIAREGARYPIAYFHLGREHETLGQLDPAAAAYSRAAAAYGEKEPQFLLDVSRVREKEGKLAAALAAMEDYARIGGRTGHTPEWTAERIAELRRKMNAAATTQTPK